MFIMFFYPGAFVNFTEDFSQITHIQQLKIYCAGCFHNIVLAIFCNISLIYLPLLLSPLYITNSGAGVYVTTVHEVF
jgi:S2P endopeptidase